jgi:hypothetical protein
VDIGKLFRDAWGLFVKDIGPLIVGMLIASIVPAVAAVVIAAATVGASISGLQVDAQGGVTGVDSMNWALLISGTVAIVVVALFLSVPLYVGILSGVFRRVREGREMAYGDAFSGFSMFGKVVWATVLLGLIFTAIFVVPTAVIVGGAAADSRVLVGVGVVVFLAAMVAYVYLGIAWVYVFPVIVDRGLAVTEAMGESRRLVHGSGWWWTFLVLFLLQLVVGAVSFALGLIPLIGAVATIVLYPFVLTYVVAMYFQARSEGQLVDAVLGWPRQAPTGPPAFSVPAAPYGTVPVPPAPPYGAPPAAPPPAVDQGQSYAPAPPPLGPPPPSADEAQVTEQPAPQTAVTQPAAPELPAQPATLDAPPKADADAWKAAADPLAAQPPAPPAPTAPLAAPAIASHEHAASETPTVDSGSGHLEKHCSQCGALIEGSDEFCQACALEVSGGEPRAAEPSAGEPATEAPAPPEAPAAPEEPRT